MANSVVVDYSDNVIVAGELDHADYLTIKVSNAGVLLWTNTYNGALINGVDRASAVAVDSSNNVIVTGHSTGSDTRMITLRSSIRAQGAPLWTNRYRGPWYGTTGSVRAGVDGSNNVIVTGSMGIYVPPTQPAFVTIKYSNAGTPFWTNRYHGPGMAQIKRML